MKKIKKILSILITVFIWNIMMIWLVWTVYALNYPTNLSTTMNSWTQLTSAMWNDIANAVNKYTNFWVDNEWESWQVWTSDWDLRWAWQDLSSVAFVKGGLYWICHADDDGTNWKECDAGGNRFVREPAFCSTTWDSCSCPNGFEIVRVSRTLKASDGDYYLSYSCIKL